MRVVTAIAAVLVLASFDAASAQDWADFVSREDGFRVNFPGQPKVETTTFRSEYGADLPARVYRVDAGGARYSMMVVNYATIEQLLTARSKQCPPFADERCTGVGAGATVGFGYWRTDVRAALVWASWQFIQRDAKVTHYMWNFVDLVEGHQLQLTNRADQSRTFASIYMHDNRLYIMEGTVPDGEPEPGLFQQSLGFVDKDGNGIRYRDYYDNDYPPPPRVGAPAAPASSPQPAGGAR
jgi:hypothetical protein